MGVGDESPQIGKLRYLRIGGVEGADQEMKVAYRGEYPTASCGLKYLFRKARVVIGVDAVGGEHVLKDSEAKVEV